jgi:hypothetical protein
LPLGSPLGWWRAALLVAGVSRGGVATVSTIATSTPTPATSAATAAFTAFTATFRAVDTPPRSFRARRIAAGLGSGALRHSL